MKHAAFFLASVAFGTSVLAADTPVAAPANLTVQQRFDAGLDAFDASDWPKAAEIYSDLETQLATGNPASRNLAIVRLRKGTALYQLRRHSEAETAILMAMDKLPATDASLKEDRRKGFVALGGIAEKKYDYPSALSHYRSAYAITDNNAAKVITLRYIVRTGIFVDPTAALVDADTAIALIRAEPKANTDWLGSASDLRGRVLLNLGRTKEARTEFTKAIK